MMKSVERVNGAQASSLHGAVKIDFKKTIWISVMSVGSVLAPFHFSWSALAVFLVSSYLTLLIGHSVGMHRMMIHQSFDAPKPLKRLLIFIGVMVGMGGPSQIIKMHDVRDWAQRLPECHVFFSHKENYFKDIFWQLFCKFEFKNPPTITIESELSQDPHIRFFDKYWWIIQILIGCALYLIGGIDWVLWGCCLRVFVSSAGHWSVTYFCHNPGPAKWHVKGAGVQASNLRFGGFITHGECWHNNHHAFPESAQIGLDPNQLDPAWAVISALEKLGYVTDVNRPRDRSQQEDLRRISS